MLLLHRISKNTLSVSGAPLSRFSHSTTAARKPENDIRLAQRLLEYQAKYVGKPITDVMEANLLRTSHYSACPAISTLKLEKAIESGQWIRVKPGTSIERLVIYDGKVLGRALIGVPMALFEGSKNTHELLCPYFDPESQTLRLWAQDRGDTGLQFSAQRFSNKGMRVIGELAVAEGLMDSLPEQGPAIVNPQNDAGLNYRYELALKEGYLGTFREWERGIRLGKVAFVMTLVREKVLARKQQFVFYRHRNYFRSTRVVIIDDSREAQAEITLPLSAFPEGAIEPTACVYFDGPTQRLRFCTLDGKDIPEAPAYPISQLCGPSKHALLQLAQVEGLLDIVPAARLDTFDLKAGIASGFYLHCHRSQISKTIASRLTIRFGDGSRQPRFRMRIPKGVEELRGLPYIDETERFRVWDKDGQRDNKLPGGVTSLDGVAVRHRWPKLFAYAQSLGYWKNL